MAFSNILGAGLYPVAIAVLMAAAVIDIRKRVIPDRLIIAGSIAGIALRMFSTVNGLMDGVLGGVSAALLLLLIHRITKGGLGLGDVKLFGCIGIYMGFEDIFSAMLLASISSGLFSLVLVCMDRNNSKREIPFAPFILVGALTAVIFRGGL